MSAVEFESGGEVYRAERLTALQQFHVSRKIAPLVPALVPIFLQIARKSKEDKFTIEAFSQPEILQPFADSLAQLSDESAEYVIGLCLSVVKRKKDAHWASVWSAAAKRSMFDDLNDLGKLLPIVVYVIKDSLGGFIAGLVSSQKETTANLHSN